MVSIRCSCVLTHYFYQAPERSISITIHNWVKYIIFSNHYGGFVNFSHKYSQYCFIYFKALLLGNRHLYSEKYAYYSTILENHQTFQTYLSIYLLFIYLYKYTLHTCMENMCMKECTQYLKEEKKEDGK